MKKFKFLEKVLLATLPLLLIGMTGANAQNRCLLKNGKGSLTIISYSDDMKDFQTDDQSVAFVSTPDVKSQVKGSSPIYTLNVYPPETSLYVSWQLLGVSDGTNLVGWLQRLPGNPDFLSIQLEEGTYQIFGWCKDHTVNCIWTKEDLVLNADTNIYLNLDECVYDVNVSLVDEDGNPFIEGTEIKGITYCPFFTWMGLTTLYFSIYPDSYTEQVPKMRFNGFDERSYLDLRVSMYLDPQKSYYIQCPTITNMHESVTVAVTADEMKVIQERFPINSKVDTVCHYHTDAKIIGANGEGSLIFMDLYSNLVFDPEQPYTIITNTKIEDPNNFETGRKTILLPTVNEWYDSYALTAYYDKDFIGSAFYLDKDGNVVREANPFFRDGPESASYPNYIPETPARTVKPADKLTFFGERTPLATYYPVAYGLNNSPYSQTFFYGGFFFSGEQSCERSCDYDSNIRVRIDNEEVFNDSICNFNVYGNSYPLDAPANVTIDVYNRHLVTNDVQKTNKTHVEFDLERDDAMPPTMTFLRVLDGNGDENIWLDRMDLSTLVFACGDYGHHFNEEDFTFDHLEYNAKPEVELLYSFDGETWLPLVFAEDESLFHIDYGNVFVAYLSQLESRAINKWVSLKFILTDEAGNSQTQELSNVFYAGENVSVNEHIAEGLKHTICPNPFTSEVKITAAQAVEGEANIAVYNVLGEQVYSKTYNCAETKEFIIDGSTWKPGVYFYSISTKDGLLQGKIVKE